MENHEFAFVFVVVLIFQSLCKTLMHQVAVGMMTCAQVLLKMTLASQSVDNKIGILVAMRMRRPVQRGYVARLCASVRNTWWAKRLRGHDYAQRTVMTHSDLRRDDGTLRPRSEICAAHLGEAFV